MQAVGVVLLVPRRGQPELRADQCADQHRKLAGARHMVDLQILGEVDAADELSVFVEDLDLRLQMYRRLAALGLERPHVVGHSFGTMVALSLFELHAAIPASLVLIGGSSYAGETKKSAAWSKCYLDVQRIIRCLLVSQALVKPQ